MQILQPMHSRISASRPSRIFRGRKGSAIDGRAPVIRSDGSPVRDFLYVEDAVGAYLAIADSLDRDEVRGEAFNAGGERPYTVGEVVELIAKLSGSGVEPDIRVDENPTELAKGNDPQLERAALLGGQSPHGMTQQRGQGAGLAALVDALVVLALGGHGLKAHPLARGRLDAVVLVVLAQEIARDAKQPRRAGSVRLVPEPPRRMPGLRKGLRGQVQAPRLRAGMPEEPRADPHRIAVVELTEGRRVLPGRQQQLGIGSGQAVRRLSRRFALASMMPSTPEACLKFPRRRG